MGFKDESHFLHIKKLCILAGLLHDVGHAAFSHTFDRGLVPQLGLSQKWVHELAGEYLIDELFKKYNYLYTDLQIDQKDV